MSIAKFSTKISNTQQIEYDTIALFCKDIHSNKVSEETGIQVLELRLNDYSCEGSLNDVLGKFTKTILGIGRKRIQILEPNDPGSSGDQVYIVQSVRNLEPCLVFKIFQQHSKNFIPEFFSLQFLFEQKISAFLAPNPYALGKCTLESKRCFLLCESVAPGRSLLHYYKDPQQFMILERAMLECGRTLAKLHHHALQNRKGLSNYMEKKTRLNFSQAIKKLTLFPQEGICLEKLNRLFENMLNLLSTDTFPMGFTHGKPILSNVFYAPETSKVTWIGLSRFAKSVDEDLKPMGILAKDFHRFITDIKFQRVSYTLDRDGMGLCPHTYMQEEKVPQLINAFYMGYIQSRPSEKMGAAVPGRNQIEFFKLKSYFSRISKTAIFDPDCSLPEPNRSIEKYQIRVILDELRLMLKSFQPPEETLA